MKLSIAVVSASFICAMAAQASGSIQPVYSLKNLGDHSSNSGAVYKKVQVRCNIHDEMRYIHRIQGATDWCAYGIREKCAADRVDAAALACLMSTEDVAALEQPQRNLEIDATLQAKLQERKKLEEELYSIEQKRIQLRQRRLELSKREAELSGVIDSGPAGN